MEPPAVTAQKIVFHVPVALLAQPATKGLWLTRMVFVVGAHHHAHIVTKQTVLFVLRVLKDYSLSVLSAFLVLINASNAQAEHAFHA
jgi:hypothetical protein